MATTTLIVTKPGDFSILRKHFKLIRYVVPDSFRFKKNRYGQLHVRLRAQLDVPFRHFFHDKLDGVSKIVIYALFPSDSADIPSVVLDFVSDDPLEYREIGFGDISLFNLIKLLQAKYFNTWPYFAGMGAYYVHAVQTNENWHVCMEIELQGAQHNIDSEGNECEIQEFFLSGHAKNFRKVSQPPDDYRRRNNAFYRRQLQLSKGMVVFEQLPFNHIGQYQGELFEEYSRRENPARLPYHKQDKSSVGSCRGYLLHQFQQRFIKELKQYGIQAKRKMRDWTQFVSQAGTANLPIQRLSQIFLFDNRLNTDRHPIGSYRDLLEKTYADLRFPIIQTIEEAQNQPVLILQDTDGSDYQEKGLFCGQEDPYRRIYRDYVDTPKQSINVNANAKLPGQFVGTSAAYLNYPMIELFDEEDEETDWAMQLQVCLYQLYLKDVVINRRPVSETLPIEGSLATLMNYAYIRKQTQGRISYHVMLQMVDDRLEFADLKDPKQRQALFNTAEAFGYEWNRIEEILKAENYLEEDEELTRYDLVLMPGKVVQLEEVQETVLYDYDTIEARLNARTQERAIQDFELIPHYDKIRSGNLLSSSDMKALGLIEGRKPFGDRETASVRFLQQLQSYDDMLADLGNATSRISLNELLELRNAEIGSIFGLPTYSGGKYNIRRVLDFYKALWNIGGFKADDVQISKGIWFDETDNAFRVADVNGFDGVQERAHSIRRFKVLIGDRPFDMDPFLEATAVKFVRFRQYTVYPYLFYLLDKYIDDVLRHQS